jgi:hypothetical protein
MPVESKAHKSTSGSFVAPLQKFCSRYCTMEAKPRKQTYLYSAISKRKEPGFYVRYGGGGFAGIYSHKPICQKIGRESTYWSSKNIFIAESSTLFNHLTRSMSEVPEKQSALKVRGVGHVKLAECPVPQPQSDELLIRVKHVALNPVVSSHVETVSSSNIYFDALTCVYFISHRICKNYLLGMFEQRADLEMIHEGLEIH